MPNHSSSFQHLLSSSYMFHDIRPISRDYFPLRYAQSSFLSVEQFDSILYKLFLRHEFIDPSCFLIKSSKSFQRPPALLTFDDGLSDHIKYVLPVLQRYKLKAIFFIPVEAILYHKVIHSHKIQFIIASGSSLESIISDIISYTHFYFRMSGSLDDNLLIFSKFYVSNRPNSSWTKEQIFITRFLREYGDYLFRDYILSYLFHKYVTKNEPDFAYEFYMSEDDIVNLSQAGMYIGGHGYHSLNSSFESPSMIASEVLLSYNFLSSFDFNSNGFDFFYSYPNGGITSCAKKILSQLNCKASFSTVESSFSPSNLDIYEIPRFDGSKLL